MQRLLIQAPAICGKSPEVVKWSLNRTAVLLQNDQSTYIAQVDGTVYEITDLLVNNSLNIDWIDAPMPSELTPLALPQPVAEGESTPEATVEVGIMGVWLMQLVICT